MSEAEQIDLIRSLSANERIAIGMAKPENVATVEERNGKYVVNFGEKYVDGFCSLGVADAARAEVIAQLHNSRRQFL